VIFKSPLAYHDLDKNTISADEGIMEAFKYNPDNTSPIEKFSYKKIVFEVHYDSRIRVFKATEMRKLKNK
jgi:hypothetical protein